MTKLSRIRVFGLTAAAALTVGTLAAAPAMAQVVNQYAYHHGYSDHHWGYGGYYDGYVGSRGAYNDSAAWQRGYDYPPPPPYYPSNYGYGYPYYDGYYSYGYPEPGVGVQVGPVGIGLW